MSELQRTMYEMDRLKRDGIMSIEILRKMNASNMDKQVALNTFKKLEKFLSDKRLSSFVAHENRRLYNDIEEIYHEIKKRIKASQEINQYENDRLNKKIIPMNELYEMISELFKIDPTQVNDITKKLDQVSFVLNDKSVDFNYVDKDLYYRYMEIRKKLIDLTFSFKEYLHYVIYVKESYDNYQQLEGSEEKQALIRHIANRYRFLNNSLRQFGIITNLNNLKEIQFFLGEYKKIMLANNPSLDENILNDFGVPENDDGMGNADGISRLI